MEQRKWERPLLHTAAQRHHHILGLFYVFNLRAFNHQDSPQCRDEEGVEHGEAVFCHTAGKRKK